MNIQLKIILFISFLFISAIGNAIFTFKLEEYGDEKLKWVNHTHEVILTTQNLLSNLTDAETGQRGFLLTKDDTYLEPYKNGTYNARKNFKKLKVLTSDNDIQQERLNQILKYINLKFNKLEETIKLVEGKNHKKSLQLVKQNHGKQYMTKIRTYLDKFIETEYKLLEERASDFKNHRARITIFIVSEIIFFIILAIFTISFLHHYLFGPLKSLIKNTRKIENGEKVVNLEIKHNHEMGYLLKNFFEMNKKINNLSRELHSFDDHDKLTGMRNRTTMHNEIYETIRHQQEFNTQFALLFISLDKFKHINETLGYEIGDNIIKETVSNIINSIGSNDTVLRTRANEFLVLIKDIKNEQEINLIASKILHYYKSPMIIKNETIEITLHIGITLSKDDTHSIDQIIKYTDIAMHESKNNNSNYTFFDKSMLKRLYDD